MAKIGYSIQGLVAKVKDRLIWLVCREPLAECISLILKVGSMQKLDHSQFYMYMYVHYKHHVHVHVHIHVHVCGLYSIMNCEPHISKSACIDIV